MSITEIRVKFDNKKNNKRAYFTAYFGPANTHLGQSGDFRSDYAWVQFESKKQFVAAVNKYLKNPNARIERLELDGNTMSASDVPELDVRHTILKAVLENI
jgi:hypothetical protein